MVWTLTGRPRGVRLKIGGYVTNAATLAGAGSGTLAAFDAGYEAVGGILARRDRLDRLIGDMAKDSPFTPVTNRLCACVGSRP